MTEFTTREWEINLTGELLMFGLLGKMLLQIPEKRWLQPLLDDEVFLEAPFAGQQPDVIQGLDLLEEWSLGFGNKISSVILDELKADYTRLFAGLAKVPVAPWESVFFTEERLVFQAQTQDVRDWYRRYGMEVNSQYKEPEDHVGLELTFVGHLAKIGLAGLTAQDRSVFDQALAAQREFVAKHLFLWVPLWCEQILEYARTDFYRGLALVIRGALTELSHILGQPLPEGRLS